ncbi:MAG: glycosyltransferase family 4 protein [Deltaproteobacteria bacterium]|nr:glycosyltransferase family 4 protein [Deltaproteobacteria bacterium]
MHIGLLFYTDSLVLQNQTQKLNGRGMANLGFLKALLQYKAEHSVSLLVSGHWEKQIVQEQVFSPHQNSCPIITFSELSKFLKEKPLQALHYPSPDLYRAFEIKKLNPTPMAVTGVTHSLGSAPFLEWLYLSLLASPQATDALICTSPAAVKVLRKLQSEITHAFDLNPLATPQIPLAIHCADFQKTPAHNLYPEFPQEEFVLLYLGRISLFTKCDLKPLLIVFRELIKRSPKKSRLILAGACEEEAYLEDLSAYSHSLGINSQISFKKNPSEELKKSLLQRAQVFLAPNDNPQETFGLSILEALASGLPIVAADWNGYKSLIENEKEGFLIPTLIPSHLDFMGETAALQIDAMNHLYFSQSTATDLEIFTEKILSLITNEELRQDMARQARQKSSAYDWSQVIPQYLDLWENLSQQNIPVKNKSTGAVKERLYTLNYHQIFSHYATQVLTEEDSFQISPLGQEALQGNIPLENPPSLDEFLPVDAVLQVLQMGGKGFRVADLSSISQGEFILMWLYKYGFVKRVS